MTHRSAVLVLIGCAFLWGVGFPLNKLVMGTMSPMVFLAARFGISAIILSPLLFRADRATWRAGLTLGLLFSVQLATFALGLSTIPPARSAFLFSVQTPLVPVLVMISTRQSPPASAVARVVVAVVGSWLLTKPEGLALGLTRGDAFTLVSALLAAVYIVVTGILGRRHDPWQLLALQFTVMGVSGLIGSRVLETPRFEPTLLTSGLLALLVVFSMMTFGGQLVGQRLVKPTEAALIFAVEPVVAAGMSYLVYGETFGPIQWLGGAMIIVAALWRPSRTS